MAEKSYIIFMPGREEPIYITATSAERQPDGSIIFEHSTRTGIGTVGPDALVCFHQNIGWPGKQAWISSLPPNSLVPQPD
ncbi:hypothetical protein [Flagellimonas sp. CMM7]|uniref:hypothetical protein n=1 Tax=Flagellimonas sp. CMM7 TaxID=2654676 RepID=UPI0013D0FF73|nr:hypothetical protein [Flagellimonas sp. CMM7]UII81231.1 hypothetical protein LV704_06865 [Flagellimonas sp. CMM7]